MTRPDYCPMANEPCQSLCDKPCSAHRLKVTAPPQRQQEKQEPVAWMHWLFGPVQLFMNIDEAMLELERLNREYPVDGNARQMLPLYTAPQRREWVGLTEEEENELWESTDSDWELMKRTEAKLREKNA